ncbi:sulfite exporter TauE/SafE family protein [Lentibacillus sediminis]|uniref:sulfite exporter TauE/SafE family protein n=1 Tax=Lentibacillus sediminis TaxID=1940529 RepID=UPI000C1C81B1|nr:sulfite exporter TauE/SafE family protein [Lentibacillus sediminis]
MEIVLFIIIILLASTLQTSTGFGFSILATPFLLLLFEPREAIQINLILSLFISLALIRRIKRDINKGVLKRFVVGSALGVPFGIITFLMIDIRMLSLTVSLVVLLLTVLLILNFRLRQTEGRDLLVGGLSGTLTSSIGMPGPPVLLYFSGTSAQKANIRGTTLAFYLFIYSVSLIIQVLFAGTNKTIWLTSVIAVPLVMAGLYLGQALFGRVNQQHFRIFTYIILLFTGVYLLVDNWTP